MRVMLKSTVETLKPEIPERQGAKVSSWLLHVVGLLSCFVWRQLIHFLDQRRKKSKIPCGSNNSNGTRNVTPE
jgi:hypothetical protein